MCVQYSVNDECYYYCKCQCGGQEVQICRKVVCGVFEDVYVIGVEVIVQVGQ